MWNQVSILVHAGIFHRIWTLDLKLFLVAWTFFFACGGCGEFKDKMSALPYDLETINAPVGSF